MLEEDPEYARSPKSEIFEHGATLVQIPTAITQRHAQLPAGADACSIDRLCDHGLAFLYGLNRMMPDWEHREVQLGAFS